MSVADRMPERVPTQVLKSGPPPAAMTLAQKETFNLAREAERGDSAWDKLILNVVHPPALVLFALLESGRSGQSPSLPEAQEAYKVIAKLKDAPADLTRAGPEGLSAATTASNRALATTAPATDGIAPSSETGDRVASPVFAVAPMPAPIDPGVAGGTAPAEGEAAAANPNDASRTAPAEAGATTAATSSAATAPTVAVAASPVVAIAV